jgi:hypothetical protein
MTIVIPVLLLLAYCYTIHYQAWYMAGTTLTLPDKIEGGFL